LSVISCEADHLPSETTRFKVYDSAGKAGETVITPVFESIVIKFLRASLRPVIEYVKTSPSASEVDIAGRTPPFVVKNSTLSAAALVILGAEFVNLRLMAFPAGIFPTAL
jgi:hypothetical protein